MSHNLWPIDERLERRVFDERSSEEAGSTQFYLGVKYMNGSCVPVNKRRAVEYYKKSAAQGHLEAQFRLAKCYRDGIGVDKDEALCVVWLRKAADQGHVEARKILDSLVLQQQTSKTKSANELGTSMVIM